MSYLHPHPLVIPRDHQHVVAIRSPATRYVATGKQTQGEFGLFEGGLAGGADGPGLHYHEGFSESFYVLEGALEIQTATSATIARAGELAYVPRRGIHGFKNASADVPARFLILFTPGIARERYFEGLAALRDGGRQPTIEQIDAFARQHDQINLR